MPLASASVASGGGADLALSASTHRHPGSFAAVEARVRAERLGDHAAREEAQERRRQAALERMASRRSASEAHADALQKSADEAARLQSLAPDSSLGLLLSGRKEPTPAAKERGAAAMAAADVEPTRRQSRRATAVAELRRRRPANDTPDNKLRAGPRSAGDGTQQRQRDGRAEAGTPPPKTTGDAQQRRSASIAPQHSSTPGPVARKPRHHLAPLDATRGA